MSEMIEHTSTFTTLHENIMMEMVKVQSAETPATTILSSFSIANMHVRVNKKPAVGTC